MKKLLLALLLGLSGCAHAEFQSIQVFGGQVDVITPDKLQDKFTPDALNVRTDHLGMLTRREGYDKYNVTPLTGLQSIRKLYDYRLTDGSEYMIANSSWSMFANTSGSGMTAIVQSLNSSYTDAYATVNGVLYRDNGYDGLGGKWDGTTYTAFTVANSTNLVSGKYMKWWHNRLWKAGVTGSPNYLYYSQAPNGIVIRPDDFNELGVNYIRVDVDGGDIITGLVIGAGDNLYVTMRYKTFQVVENTAGTFILRLVSPSIGCLYDSTVDILQGYPIWLSARGVERFDGNGFELISAPIDNYVKALPQLTSSVGSWVQTTAADWGAGTCINVDTTTVSDSIQLPLTESKINQQNIGTGVDPVVNPARTGYQTFMTSYTAILTTASVYGIGDIASPENMRLSIKDNSGGLLATHTLYIPVTNTLFWMPVNFSTWSVVLTSGVVYRLEFVPVNSKVRIQYSEDNRYDRGSADGSGSAEDYVFQIYLQAIGNNRYGQWSSQVFSGTGIKNWSTLSIDQSLPPDTTVQWFVSPATASVLCSTSSIFPVNAPSFSIAMSSPVPFVMLFASMSATNPINSPQINSVTLNYLKNAVGSPAQTPVGITYKDRYYLFCATDTSTNINNVALCYQRTNDWQIFNDIYAQSACVYLDRLYTGSSANTGQLYEMFKTGVYSDDGKGYDSHYVTPSLACGNPLTEKWFQDVWLTATGNGDNITLSTKLDEYPTWTNYTIPTTSQGIFTFKVDMPAFTKGYYFTLKVGNSSPGENFGIKRLDLEYRYKQMR